MMTDEPARTRPLRVASIGSPPGYVEAEAVAPAPRACRDCRWVDDSWATMCVNPRMHTWDSVEGWLPMMAAEARDPGRRCGPRGKLWERRLNLWSWLRSFWA